MARVPVKVETYEHDDSFTDQMTRITHEEPDSMNRIDWSNSSDRKWLMNHMMWAMHNGHAVLLRPESN